jgi:type III pantothenate kinase
MLLAIDVGNTHLRLGTARDGVLGAPRRAATPADATPDEVETLLGSLLALDGLRLDEVGAFVVSSTVPAATAAVEGLASRRAISCLTASAVTVPLPVRVERPGDVGPDRLVNAYAVAHLYGVPAVVVDCGTATTLDAVDHDGAFVGGAIAPGLVLGLEALAARTARLPRVTPELPDGPIGRDTVAAIRAGTVLGHRAMIEGLLAQMRRQLAAAAGLAAREVRVVLTGGLATLPWARTIEGIDAIDPELTLRGLVLVHRAVTGTAGALTGTGRV